MGTFGRWILEHLFYFIIIFLRAECCFSSPSVSVTWHLDVQTFGVMQKWKRISRNREREGPVRNQSQPFPGVGFDLLKNHASRLHFWLIWYCLFVAVWALLFVPKLSFLLVSLAGSFGAPPQVACALIVWPGSANGRPFLAVWCGRACLGSL